MSLAKKKYSDFTPEQKEKHRQRTLKWRTLNREKYLAQSAAAQRRRKAKNPERAREYRRRYQEKNPGYRKQWQAENRESGRAAAKRWRLKNPAATKLVYRACRLKRHYGLTLDQFNQMVSAQSGTCAICLETFGKGPRDTHIDHCHATGKVRAILCNNCNNMIGRARDNPDLLRKGAEYLERWRSV